MKAITNKKPKTAGVDPNLHIRKKVAGGAAGTMVGAVVAGPIGAIVGGVLGTVIGTAAEKDGKNSGRVKAISKPRSVRAKRPIPKAQRGRTTAKKSEKGVKAARA